MKKAIIITAALVSALILTGCPSSPVYVDDGNGGGGGNTSALIGEWKVVEESYSNSNGESNTYTVGNDEDWYMFYVFSSPNKLKAAFFEKVGDFWIEGSDDFPGTWSTRGQYLYLNYDDGDVDSSRYSISGNTLTMTDTYYDDYDNTTNTSIRKFTKTSLSSFRGTLGTVRTQDSRLSRTYWRLDSKNERLEFYTGFDYNGNRYFEDEYVSGSWYTSGSNLFLIDTDWECLDENCNEDRLIIKETVQFTYAVSGSVGSRTLTLTNSSKGVNDAWREVTEDEFYNSPASALSKSKRGKRFGGGALNPFRSR
jgi:virulence family protein